MNGIPNAVRERWVAVDLRRGDGREGDTAIAPGPVATELFLTGKPQAVIDRISGMNPMNRLAEPEDIAATVSFLAGPDGRRVNGQVLFDNRGAA